MKAGGIGKLRRPGAWWAALLLGMQPFLAMAGWEEHSRLFENPTPESFPVCHEYGCKVVDVVSLAPELWRKVQEIFSVSAATPALERQSIARAVSVMEVMVGEAVGTSRDKGKNIDGMGQPGQMDCVDESLNTTTYLQLMKSEGLLKWHDIDSRATRGWLILGWPHSTAVVREAQSGERWAVDSWFLDNGQPPFIVPLTEWYGGWRPKGL